MRIDKHLWIVLGVVLFASACAVVTWSTRDSRSGPILLESKGDMTRRQQLQDEPELLRWLEQNSNDGVADAQDLRALEQLVASQLVDAEDLLSSGAIAVETGELSAASILLRHGLQRATDELAMPGEANDPQRRKVVAALRTSYFPLVKLGDFAGAETRARLLLNMPPGSYSVDEKEWTHIELAEALIGRGDPESAAAELRQLLEGEPNTRGATLAPQVEAEAVRTVGWALYACSRYDAAIPYLTTAVQQYSSPSWHIAAEQLERFASLRSAISFAAVSSGDGVFDGPS